MEEEYFNLETVNRGVAIIKAKQPFADWLNQLPDHGPEEIFTLETVNNDSMVYLIPDFDNNEEGKKYIATIASPLFEILLEGWTTDETLWPKNRTLKIML